MTGDFPGCTVTRAQCFHFKGHKFSPGQGAKILHYIWYGLKKKKKRVHLLNVSNWLIHDRVL